MGLEQITQPPQVPERVDAGVVAVAPGQGEGIVADLAQVPQLEAGWLEEADQARVALAGRARAATP